MYLIELKADAPVTAASLPSLDGTTAMHSSTIRHKILTIPGLDNSGPGHWQSLWEQKFPDCERIDLCLLYTSRCV